MKTGLLAPLLVPLALSMSACTAMPDGSGRASRVDTAAMTLVPDAAWNCGMAEGIPVPERGTLLLEAEVRLDNVYDVGKTPYGQRQVAVTQEGTMKGARITGTGISGNDVRIVYDFEAPAAGQYAWLNSGKYVGRRTIDAAKKTMKLAIYDVTNVAVSADAVQRASVRKPAGVPPQPWDYRKPGPGEERGETILVESVALGRSRPSRMASVARAM
jgi:hypothetical protein